ncbi:hypothetical protein BD289DRAFT_126319 [Coniella lustricola]|uniref:Uncharacterized protein n=1 Tax=Coniella lustricola TaxID=2025994 RepID=A0A2T3AFZ0_9PEZI|nr:hypothetical protein BD289DRAFT_126319 [Coniella lustricola]
MSYHSYQAARGLLLFTAATLPGFFSLPLWPSARPCSTLQRFARAKSKHSLHLLETLHHHGSSTRAVRGNLVEVLRNRAAVRPAVSISTSVHIFQQVDGRSWRQGCSSTRPSRRACSGRLKHRAHMEDASATKVQSGVLVYQFFPQSYVAGALMRTPITRRTKHQTNHRKMPFIS